MMKEIFSKRLKSARIQAKLTQEELAEKVSITKNAVSKYEKGEMMAEHSVLRAMAQILKVSIDFFFRPYEIELTRVEYRKKTCLPKRDENAITEKILRMVENYLKTEEILNISSVFEHPFANVLIRSKADMEQYAEELTLKWKLGNNGIQSVFRILENNHIKVIEMSATTDFNGWSAFANDKYPVIVLNTDITPERKRFTALHELAHLLFEFDESLSDKDIEKLCHYFAGALLMPAPLMYSLLSTSRSRISGQELKTYNRVYGISYQAFMYRALELDIIKAYQYKQFMFKISKNRREEGLSLYRGEKNATRFNSLIYRGLTEDLMSLNRAAELSGIPVEELEEGMNINNPQ